MFTGLIQGQGTIEALDFVSDQCRLRIKALYALDCIVIGESIAVNGTCLTVERFHGTTFEVYASKETLTCTTLGERRCGDCVNLERALALGDRLGGHIVSGHVDCVAQVVQTEMRGESRLIVLSFPERFAPEVVNKGSVTLDGISLTINSCTANTLSVNVIPETWRVTTASAWHVGANVNMETDILGKYVRRNLMPHTDHTSPSSLVDMNFLREHGFL